MAKRTVPVEIREMLLKDLGVRPGEAVVRRQRSQDGDQIVVVAYPGSRLTATEVPTKYHGYPVSFEKHSSVPEAG